MQDINDSVLENVYRNIFVPVVDTGTGTDNIVKPDATTGSWTATVSGTDPKTIVYVTVEDDIDQDGTWEFQAHVENVTGTTKLTGERVTETVYPTIEVEA